MAGIYHRYVVDPARKQQMQSAAAVEDFGQTCPCFREPQEGKDLPVISVGLDKIDLLYPYISQFRMIAEASTLSSYVVMDIPCLDKLLVGCKDSL